MAFARSWEEQGAAGVDPAMALARLRRLAWLIDAAGRVPGTRFRFGLNSLVGLVPGIGDGVLAAISLYIVFEAYRLGVPRDKITRMVFNVGVEAALGAFPVLGDFLDVVWKANLRNIAVIDAHFAGRAPHLYPDPNSRPAESARAYGPRR